MLDIDNHMIVDEIWEDKPQKPCSKCGWQKRLCECEDERD